MFRHRPLPARSAASHDLSVVTFNGKPVLFPIHRHVLQNADHAAAPPVAVVVDACGSEIERFTASLEDMITDQAIPSVLASADRLVQRLEAMHEDALAAVQAQTQSAGRTQPSSSAEHHTRGGFRPTVGETVAVLAIVVFLFQIAHISYWETREETLAHIVASDARNAAIAQLQHHKTTGQLASAEDLTYIRISERTTISFQEIDQERFRTVAQWKNGSTRCSIITGPENPDMKPSCRTTPAPLTRPSR